MFAVAVLLWVVVYVPNWGTQKEEQKQRSSFGRKFSKNRSVNVKKTSDGVSDLAIRNKNIQIIRRLFSVLLVASFAVFTAGIVMAFSAISWLFMSAIALAVFLLSASTLRSSRRAWSANQLPESNLARRIGELEEVTLASVSPIGEKLTSVEEKKLDSDELDRILKRRRAI